mmetsp:Transcript_22300/g.64835  ORF Transcript_22300/g.64835 Transcript_22300/m.64835 type:complete len:409 (+) Transcript_22300:22-1248(+)
MTASRETRDFHVCPCSMCLARRHTHTTHGTRGTRRAGVPVGGSPQHKRPHFTLLSTSGENPPPHAAVLITRSPGHTHGGFPLPPSFGTLLSAQEGARHMMDVLRTLLGGLDGSLVLVGLLEGELVALHGDGDESLEGVGDGVGHGCHGGDASAEGQAGDVAEGGVEATLQHLVGDVQHVGAEHGAIVVDGLKLQTVGERPDVELLQQDCLGVAHLVTLEEQLHGAGDLDLTLDNLRRNLQGLEERGLSGVALRGAGRDNHIDWSDGADAGRSGHHVLLEDLAHLTEVRVREDKAHVALDQGQHVGELVARVSLEVVGHNAAHHGVLAHEHRGVHVPESKTDLLHLAGAHVVNPDNEELGELVDEVLHALKVLLLLFFGKTHGDSRWSAVLSSSLKLGVRLYPTGRLNA